MHLLIRKACEVRLSGTLEQFCLPLLTSPVTDMNDSGTNPGWLCVSPEPQSLSHGCSCLNDALTASR